LEFKLSIIIYQLSITERGCPLTVRKDFVVQGSASA